VNSKSQWAITGGSLVLAFYGRLRDGCPEVHLRLLIEMRLFLETLRVIIEHLNPSEKYFINVQEFTVKEFLLHPNTKMSNFSEHLFTYFWNGFSFVCMLWTYPGKGKIIPSGENRKINKNCSGKIWR
jgi:hypothetical protein